MLQKKSDCGERSTRMKSVICTKQFAQIALLAAGEIYASTDVIGECVKITTALAYANTSDEGDTAMSSNVEGRAFASITAALSIAKCADILEEII